MQEIITTETQSTHRDTEMIIQNYTLVLYVVNKFAKLFQSYFSVTSKTIIERKLCDLRVPRLPKNLFGGQVRGESLRF